MNKPLTVAWISDFPIEWLSDLPEPLRTLPRRHPATWEMVLLDEFEQDPGLRLHVVLLRQRVPKGFSFDRKGVSFHILKASNRARLLSFFWVDTLLIRRLCRRLRPDLIQAWGMEKGAGLIASRLEWPYVFTVQGLIGWYKERVPLSMYDKFTGQMERFGLPRAPLVTTESAFAVRFLKERYPGLHVQQAEHAPSRHFFAVQRQPRINPPHFVTVGSMGYRKGTDLLFKAMQTLSSEIPFRLTLITGRNPAFLEKILPEITPEVRARVEFKHDLLPHEVAKELETPTLLILPTRADTSPNAVKEAAVAAVPVVASDVGGIPDYIFPGQNGILFPPDDLKGLLDAIRSACAHPLLGSGMVEARTLVQVREYLSPARMARNFRQAYETALQGGTP